MNTEVILVMGIDESGKSELISSYILGRQYLSEPTEEVEETPCDLNTRPFIFRELGGRFRFRSNWSKHFDGVNALIYVVNSQDHGRLTESFEEYSNIKHQINIPTLIVFNKQFTKWSIPYDTLIEKFQIKDENCNVKTICFGNGNFEDFRDGIEFLLSKI